MKCETRFTPLPAIIAVCIIAVIAICVIAFVSLDSSVPDYGKLRLNRVDDGTVHAKLVVQSRVGTHPLLFQLDTGASGPPSVNGAFVLACDEYALSSGWDADGMKRMEEEEVGVTFNSALSTEVDLERGHGFLSRFVVDNACTSYSGGYTAKVLTAAGSGEETSGLWLCGCLQMQTHGIGNGNDGGNWENGKGGRIGSGRRNKKAVSGRGGKVEKVEKVKGVENGSIYACVRRRHAEVLTANVSHRRPNLLTMDYIKDVAPSVLWTRDGVWEVCRGVRAAWLGSVFGTESAEYVNGIPAVFATLMGESASKQVKLLIDTGGGFAVLLNPSALDGGGAGNVLASTPYSVEHVSVHGDSMCGKVGTSSVRIAGSTLQSVPVVVNTGKAGVSNADGLIGMGLLRCMDIYLGKRHVGLRLNGQKPISAHAYKDFGCKG